MNINKRIIHLLIVVCVMFLSLITYLLYINMFKSEELATNPYNMRQWEKELDVKRGNIYDRNGTLLAESVMDEQNGVHIRRYPYRNLYSHIIGYTSSVYGKTQLEKKYDRQLLAKDGISLSFEPIKKGYDLRLTLDHELQSYAHEQLSGKSGAIVALDPHTGEMLACVSYPDFDPTSEVLESEWTNIVEQENSPLLARATQGLYPPGSTYKIVTAAAAYENDLESEEFNDTGKFEEKGITVENYGKKAHGKIDLPRAFAVSSNFVFCTLGYEMGPDVMLEISERFGINKPLTDFDIETSTSTIDGRNLTDADAALIAMGQGRLLATPLQMALITSAVANDGVMMRPYLVSKVTSSSGVAVETHYPQTLYRPIEAGCANYVQGLMEEVVESGSGTSAQISGIKVAGKTGTSENEKEKDHAWFVGYAPADDPQIAVAVILENDGSSGGTAAAPIARNVIKKYLEE